MNETLRIKNDMLEEAQSAYNMLVAQLQEDGSTLKQKDRERYRQVLTELKDYEIYKNVMEAALTTSGRKYSSINSGGTESVHHPTVTLTAT